MEFCTSCGSRLMAKKKQTGRKTSLIFVCSKCGYKKESPNKSKLKIAKIVEPNPQKMVTVIGKEEQRLRTLPTVRVECGKCGNNLAYAWQVQTRGADESSTQFFRCTKCGYTFREYS